MMLLLVASGYFCLGDAMAIRSEFPEGSYAWQTCSTIKFTNNWLREGALNLHFRMYEQPLSIEFEDAPGRELYISYPPGAIVPVYWVAKLLGFQEISLPFMRHFMNVKFFLDCILVCILFHGILSRILPGNSHSWRAFVTPAFLAIAWMCIPGNLYFSRNVYFSDQAVITLALVFFILEINAGFFKDGGKLRCLLFHIAKTLIALAGVLTEYYFLGILLVCWLLQIPPPLSSCGSFIKRLRSFLLRSIAYVLPVTAGVGFFAWQVFEVSGFEHIVSRTTGKGMGSGLKAIRVLQNNFLNFSYNFTLPGIALLFICTGILGLALWCYFWRQWKCGEVLPAPLKIAIILFIPAFLQILFLPHHSGVHEFSVIKLIPATILSPLLIIFLSSPLLSSPLLSSL